MNRLKCLQRARPSINQRSILQGNVGIPLIDAAIREMCVSGFMSGRARQFVASYVVLELRLDWRVGAELFESCLVDYDVCANWGNWMRAAGVSGQVPALCPFGARAGVSPPPPPPTHPPAAIPLSDQHLKLLPLRAAPTHNSLH